MFAILFINFEAGFRIRHILTGGSGSFHRDPLENALKFKMPKWEIYEQRF